MANLTDFAFLELEQIFSFVDGHDLILGLIFSISAPRISPSFKCQFLYHKGGRMLQAKFSVEEAQARFLKNHKDYGFKDKSSMLRAALNHFKKKFELRRLKESADLYSEIYSEDEALKELTDTAATGWPE